MAAVAVELPGSGKQSKAQHASAHAPTYPFAFCFAITNMTPEHSPTSTLARLGSDHPLSNRNKPMMDTGILFKEPCAKETGKKMINFEALKPQKRTGRCHNACYNATWRLSEGLRLP